MAAAAAAPSGWPEAGPYATLEDIRARQAAFAAARDWTPFHTPRNLVLALVGEVCELSECFQWKGDWGGRLRRGGEGVGGSRSATGGTDCAAGDTGASGNTSPSLPSSSALGPDWSAEEVTHLGEELADVALYLIRLADICGVDLPSAIARKVELNGVKYPPGRARARAAKYTTLAAEAAAEAAAGTPTIGSAAAAAAVVGESLPVVQGEGGGEQLLPPAGVAAAVTASSSMAAATAVRPPSRAATVAVASGVSAQAAGVGGMPLPAPVLPGDGGRVPRVVGTAPTADGMPAVAPARGGVRGSDSGGGGDGSGRAGCDVGGRGIGGGGCDGRSHRGGFGGGSDGSGGGDGSAAASGEGKASGDMSDRWSGRLLCCGPTGEPPAGENQSIPRAGSGKGTGEGGGRRGGDETRDGQ
ncbi:hypothetical protein MMPV_000551 [Pyropia vietnamensis]